MQTTKQQILTLLKRTGSVTVEEAAGALAIASMTARQHLVVMERDGLVKVDKVRRSTGRPHFVFSLTPKAEEMFPRRYDLLTQILLEEACSLTAGEIAELSHAERQSLLVRRTAQQLADHYRFQVQGRSIADRVSAATDVLQLIGGFAEWYETDAGYEIRDYNCVFSWLVSEEEGQCEWHVQLLTELLNYPAQHEHMLDGKVRCCRYVLVDTARADPAVVEPTQKRILS